MNDTLRLDNRLDELPRVRAWLTQLPVMRVCAPGVIEECWLILEEVLTNIISYGYDDKQDRKIEITVKRDGERLVLKFRDDAKAFNPLEQTARSGEHPHFGGWGLQLVRSFSDAAHYERQKRYNVLTIQKAITPR
jgi:anti-sigma regulatory factor (Ser/Thr protein kinase)